MKKKKGRMSVAVRMKRKEKRREDNSRGKA